MRRPVGVKWVLFFCFFIGQGFSPAESPLSPPFHPHSWLSDFVRSVPVGCSRFSRCCHLLIDLSSVSRRKLGQAINAVTGTRLWALLFLSKNVLTLCRRRHRSLVAIAQGFVDFSAHPQTM